MPLAWSDQWIGLEERQLTLMYGRENNQQLYAHRWSVGGIITLCSLLLLLSACNPFSSSSPGGGTNPTATDTTVSTDTPTAAVSPSPTAKLPTITLQVGSNCPTLSISWDSLAGTHANVNKVQKVTCGNLEGGTLVALVIVRYYAADQKMDFAVYDNLAGTPTRRFGATGLVQGDAAISPTNTITTAQNANNDPVGPNLFKEYAWNGSTFGQVIFSGLYPDVTHYQAEHSQAMASSTNTSLAAANAWRTSAFPLLKRLALSIFHWTVVTPKVITYDSRTGTYVIQVSNGGLGGGGFVANLFRLDNVATNVFEVQQLTPLDGNTTITSPASGATVTSPVSISGNSLAQGSILGRIVLYDDNLIIVGDSGTVHSPVSSGYVNFTQSVTYQLDALGIQEGIVAFYATNQNNTAFTNQIALIKVFFSA